MNFTGWSLIISFCIVVVAVMGRSVYVPYEFTYVWIMLLVLYDDFICYSMWRPRIWTVIDFSWWLYLGHALMDWFLWILCLILVCRIYSNLFLMIFVDFLKFCVISRYLLIIPQKPFPLIISYNIQNTQKPCIFGFKNYKKFLKFPINIYWTFNVNSRTIFPTIKCTKITLQFLFIN